MSSYIVDDSTINRILAAAQRYGCHASSMIMPPPPKNIIGPEPTYLHWALLGGKMREMNVVAVVARYGPSESLPGPCPLLPYEYQSITGPGPIQAIKSLACYLYQCAEGAVPKLPLYQRLRDWEAALCRHYVTKSDEWQQAEWA